MSLDQYMRARQREREEAYKRILEALEQQKRICSVETEAVTAYETLSSLECDVHHGLNYVFKSQKEEGIELFYKDLHKHFNQVARQEAQNISGKLWHVQHASPASVEMETMSVAIKMHDKGALVREQIKAVNKMKKKIDPLAKPGNWFTRMFR